MAASKGLLLLPLCLGLLTTMAAATQFKVGDSMGWTVPSDTNAMSYNQWAERHRFKIGDTLLFVYTPGSDSVLQVSQEAYNSCNTSSPIHSYNDGNTVFALDRSGPFYFISGVEENCLRKESLVLVVLADRSSNGGSSSSGSNPSPPPTSSSSSSSPPPPPPTDDSASPPTTSPSSPSPPKSGASLKVVGFMGTVGALLGSLLVM